MKRTTLLLNPDCLIELKKLAASNQQTLSSLVDQFLREGLKRSRQKTKGVTKVNLPTFKMGEARVDISDRDRLEELMLS